MLIIQKDRYEKKDIQANLLNWYLYNPNNCINWYGEAFEFCTIIGEKYNVNPIKVAGIVAALSPQKNWPENKKLAVTFIRTGSAGQYSVLVNKAIDILECKAIGEDLILAIHSILHGMKISSFFMNIVSDKQYVTIDRHIISAAVGYSYGTITDKGYKYLAQLMIDLSVDLQIQPKVFQAVIWSNFRDVNVRKFEDKVPF